MFEHEGASTSKSDVDQQYINSSKYFVSTPDKPTSKSLFFEHEGASVSKSDVDQQYINSSKYFVSTPDKLSEHNMSYNTSPSIESDHSNYSFSENSVDFSPEENLSDDISDETNILLGLYIYFLRIYYYYLFCIL